MSIMAVIGIVFLAFWSGFFCAGLMANRKMDEMAGEWFRFHKEER